MCHHLLKAPHAPAQAQPDCKPRKRQAWPDSINVPGCEPQQQHRPGATLPFPLRRFLRRDPARLRSVVRVEQLEVFLHQGKGLRVFLPPLPGNLSLFDLPDFRSPLATQLGKEFIPVRHDHLKERFSLLIGTDQRIEPSRLTLDFERQFL